MGRDRSGLEPFRAAPGQPARTATLLLTGVEQARLLWERDPGAATAALARHQELIDAVARAHGSTRTGPVGEGDSVLAVFDTAEAAVAAALAVQQSLAATAWPGGLVIRVRMGIYTGEMRGPDGRDQAQVATQRCARVRDVAHGGQILLAAATAALAADTLPDGAWLVDLGVHRLRDLSRPERLFELRHAGLAGGFPPPRSLDVLPNNLPAQLTSFVGRARELGQVRRLLAAQRLVTLAGAGGCGKTRLALQAAAEQADQWPDGVWWVDLGAVTDPGLVARLTAATLHLLMEPAGRPLQALAVQLRGRRLLVCLDTCEHLLDVCAELTQELLRTCPQVSVLTTSREPLGVPGETVWRVPSLAEEEAVRLFTERATLVRSGFDLAACQDAVGAICRRLDGIPLAIELAAAWVRVLSPAQIAAGMDDQFRLLAGGSRGVIARHRTLGASMAWSHDLLDEADRVMFRRLAVFAGGFTLAAARAVCTGGQTAGEEGLAAIGRLADKSLIVVDESEGEARYRLLDTIRQYAGERLEEAGEGATTRDRHLDYFLTFAEQADSGLEREPDRWRQRLETEHDNVRAALRWGLAAAGPGRGRRLAAAMAQLWFLHGHTQEGLGFLERAIALAPADRSRLQGRLLAGAGMAAMVAGRPPQAAEAAQRGLDIAVEDGDDRTRGRCLMLMAYGVFYHDFAAAQDLCVQARSFSEAAGDDFATGFTLMVQAWTLHEQDRHRESLAAARQGFERATATGERFCAALTRNCEAYGVLFGGDVRRAVALAEEAVRIAEPLGGWFLIGNLVSNLAWFKSVSGDLEDGLRLLQPIAQAIEDAGMADVSWMAFALGRLHLCGGDLGDAVSWFERATRFAEPTTANRVVCKALPGLAAALRRLGRHDDAQATADQAAALARELGAMHPLSDALEEQAFLAAAGDPARAEDLHHQSLAIRAERGLRPFIADSLEALAGLAARAGKHQEAARLLAACAGAREQMGYPRAAIDRPGHGRTVAAVSAALGEDAFRAAWAEGTAMPLDEAVSYAARGRGARDRPSTGWGSLTPTELDVVRLAVACLSNAEIGQRLFVSRATVKTHLSHVFAKLGVANRTELAAVASRRAEARPPPEG